MIKIQQVCAVARFTEQVCVIPDKIKNTLKLGFLSFIKDKAQNTIKSALDALNVTFYVVIIIFNLIYFFDYKDFSNKLFYYFLQKIKKK